jgi:rieske iron-sulfur protein
MDSSKNNLPYACRRGFLKVGLGLGVQIALSSPLPGQDTSSPTRPKQADLLVKASDTAVTPLTPADIPVSGRQTMAWAMDPVDGTIRSGSRLNRILLVRLDPGKLAAETKPRAVEGVVAYSAICTHAGCEVTEWVADQQRLFCPCHESTFDPADGARAIDGPATKALPALSLGLTRGKLVVLNGFTAPITFETQ